MKKSIIPMLTPLLLMNVNFGCEGRIPSNNCFYVDDPVGCDKIYFLLFFVKQKFFYAMWTGVYLQEAKQSKSDLDCTFDRDEPLQYNFDF